MRPVSSLEALTALLQPLLTTGTPTKVAIGTRTFIDAVHAWAGCKDATQCHLAGESPGGKVGRRAFKGKSDYVNAPLPKTAIETMVRWIGARQEDPVLGRGAITGRARITARICHASSKSRRPTT